MSADSRSAYARSNGEDTRPKDMRNTVDARANVSRVRTNREHRSVMLRSRLNCSSRDMPFQKALFRHKPRVSPMSVDSSVTEVDTLTRYLSIWIGPDRAHTTVASSLRCLPIQDRHARQVTTNTRSEAASIVKIDSTASGSPSTTTSTTTP